MLGGVPISSIPISSIDLASLPISSIPISSITIDGTPISSIPIPTDAAVRSRLVLATCDPAGCSTFGDAVSLNAFNDGLTVADIAAAVGGGPVRATLDFYFGSGDLGSLAEVLKALEFGDIAEHSLEGALGDLTVQQLAESLGPDSKSLGFTLGALYGDITIGDLYAEGGDLGKLTLADLVFAMLGRDEYAWEDAPFETADPADLVGDPGADLRKVTYTIDVKYTAPAVDPSLAPHDGLLTLQLPLWFTYHEDSARLNDVEEEPSVEGDPAAGGQTLTWRGLGVRQDGTLKVTLDVHPGLHISLQPDEFTARATIALAGLEASDTKAAQVEESFENGPTGPYDLNNPYPIEKDTVYLGHISRPDDKDYFSIQVHAGEVVSYFLSQPGGDPGAVLLRPGPGLTTVATTNSAGRTPVNNSATVITDVAGQTLSETGTIPSTQTISDSRIVGSSDQPPGTDEMVSTGTITEPGIYTLVVEGNHKDISDLPYAIRVKVSKPPKAPVCTAPNFAFAGQGLVATAPLPTGDITNLFIVNQKRLGDAFGTAEAANIVASLNGLAQNLTADSTFPGKSAVLFIDAQPGLAGLYDIWDKNPCDVDAANEIVTAINEAVDNVRAQSSLELQNVVIVGGDEIIPFFRTPDPTLRWNERHFAGDIASTGSATWGALLTSHSLTDAPYGTLHPIAWLDRYLFVPEIGVGRLVESPEDIMAQVQAFLDSGGRLSPGTGLSVGYDFLADGAAEIADEFAAAGRPVDRLINETWTGADLLSTLNAGAGFDPVSLNAHFDQGVLQSAAGDASPTTNDLVAAADVQWDPPPGTIIFSMGCHAGLNVSGFLLDSPGTDVTDDWAQTLTRDGAVFIANTGYGYGDTDEVGLTERLMSLYAQKLLGGSRDAGQALWLAQQAYYGQLGAYGVYDEKVLMQSTFYGLPMYRVGGGPGGESDNPKTTIDSTGLRSSHLSVFPSFAQESPASGVGTYWSAVPNDSEYRFASDPTGERRPVEDASVQLTVDRPIQPRLSVDVTQSGYVAHGAVVESIIGQSDITPVTPVISDPIIINPVGDQSTSVQAGEFPLQVQTVSAYRDASGDAYNLVLLPGQFFVDDNGVGTQRLFDRMDMTVYYNDNSDDGVAPDLLSTAAPVLGGQVNFMVEAEDRLPTDTFDEANRTGHPRPHPPAQLGQLLDTR